MLPTLTREQVEAAAEVVMRVPGLFIIDYWWTHERSQSIPQTLDAMEILNSVIINLVLLSGFLLLLLPLNQVMTLYCHFVSGLLLAFSHLLSKMYVAIENKEEVDADAIMRGESFYKKHFYLLTFHGFVAAVVSYLIDGLWKPFAPTLGCYILPILARLADLPLFSLQILHNFSSAVIAFNIFLYITHHVPTVLDFAKMAYNDILAVIETNALFATLWNKLFVPNYFLIFWGIEFVVKFTRVVYLHSDSESGLNMDWHMVLLTTLSSLCSSPVAVVATSVTVSYLSYYALLGTRAYLQGQFALPQDNYMNNGYCEGFTLVILAMQTGLTEIKMPARIGVMIIILFIVLSCLLQSMLDIAEPIVLALSASGSHRYGRHLRAMSLCLVLLILPLYFTHILTTVFPIDIWMMVVLSSFMLISIQVIDLLIVHCLFLYDSSRSDTWENLDDIVYYTRAVTKVLEFIVAVFVLGMAMGESSNFKWDWINGSILVVHCYFNVWQRLKNGWQSFLLRRAASKKSESLPAATALQLQDLNDVCSICFSAMKSACVTPCQHYFHRTCLRKWLYVQDKCPLCHGVITMPNETESIE